MSAARARPNPSAENEVRAALHEMEVQALNFAFRFIQDAKVRQAYARQTKAFSEHVLSAYRAGDLSARQAGEAAHQMRNEIMEMARLRSSDLGRAKAQAMKAQGLDFDDLAAKYAKKKFGRSLKELSAAQRDEVFLEIAAAAGRANPKVTVRTARLGAAGRGLFVLSLCVSAYNVGTAEYKVHALGREAAGLGGGFGGGAAGGALAGIWLGPIGVAVGVVVGGVLGSIVADQVYVEATGPREIAVRKFLPAFTGFLHVEEEAMARALIRELGIDLDSVLEVFRELDRTYTSDVDDVAVLYVEGIQRETSATIAHGLKLHTELRQLLIESLESGWTSGREKRAIEYLRSLAR